MMPGKNPGEVLFNALRSIPQVFLAASGWLLDSWVMVIGAILVMVALISALGAPLISPYPPNKINLDETFQEPNARHLLGTDALGRDVLSRIIYGARVSLIVGAAAVLLSATFGTVLGLIAGYYGGWLDAVIMRIADIQLAVPFMALAIALAAVLQPGLRNIIIVLAITGWVTYARVTRGEVLSQRKQEFVLAAISIGASDLRILLRHLLPNVLPLLLTIAPLEVARMILTEAALSFLGLGVQPQIPSWGSLIADGRSYLASAWWVATFPGMAAFATVLGVNLVAEELRR